MVIALRNYQNAVLLAISLATAFLTELLKKIILLNIQNNKHVIETLLMCILFPFPCIHLTTVCEKHGNILVIIVTRYSEGESFAV